MPVEARGLVLWTLWTGLLLGCLHLGTGKDIPLDLGGAVGVEWRSSVGSRRYGAELADGVGIAAQAAHRTTGTMSRRRRNILFPSGVKLCAQETLEQAIKNHLDYFHLRVCQETVWEAYKIFWDRLPDREEYRDWMSRCLDGSVSVMEIGRHFSQSQEHIHLIRTDVSVDVTELVTSVTSVTSTNATLEDVTSVEVTTVEVTSVEVTPVEVTPVEVTPVEVTPVEVTSVEVTTIGNEIGLSLPRPPRPLKEQVVELYVRLRGETFTNALRDPSSSQHLLLSRQFTRRVQDAFDQVPGFKSVYVVEFRGLAVLVHYAITLEVDSTGISNHTLDSIILRNNVVERTYPGAAEQPTVVYTITDFRNYITEALHRDPFLTNASLHPEYPPAQPQNEPSTRSPEPSTPSPEPSTLSPEPSTRSPERSTPLDLASTPPDLASTPPDLASSPSDLASTPPDLASTPPDLASTPPDLASTPPDLASSPSDLASSPSDLASTPPDLASTPPDLASTPPDLASSPSDLASSPSDLASTPPDLASSPSDLASMPPNLASTPPDLASTPPDLASTPPDLASTPPDLASSPSDLASSPSDLASTPPDLASSPSDLASMPPNLASTPPDLASTPPDLASSPSDLASSPSDLASSPSDLASTPPDLASTPPDLASTPLDLASSPPNLASTPPQPQNIKVDGSEEEVFSDPSEVVVEHLSPQGPSPDSPLSDAQPTATAITATVEPVLVTEPVPEVLSTEAAEPLAAVEPVLLQPDSDQQEDFEVLEEQHVGMAQPVTPTRPPAELAPEDLAEDEVMLVTTTTTMAAPVAMVSTEQNISLSPEKESPFTRVSDTAPEDDENIPESPHHDDHIPESPHHDDHIPESPHHDDHIPESPHHDDHIPESPHHDDGLIPESPHHDYHIPESPHHDDGLIPVSSAPPPGTSHSVWAENQTEGVSMAPTDPGVHGVPPSSEIQLSGPASSALPEIDLTFDLSRFQDAAGADGDSSGLSGEDPGAERQAVAMPTAPGRALTVFFSLRVTNMRFSMDLFNKSSAEYQDLEQRFLHLLVPYLQSNLSNFQNLEILNFQNGSVVVNSRMRFGKPVPQGVATVVHLILEDFASTAYHTMDLAIDKLSLDVESGDEADPCKFQACNEFSRCAVTPGGEAECVCSEGYVSVGGLPCSSLCSTSPPFCLNDGRCDLVPGRGAICRCPVGDSWWYRGRRCQEYVSEPLVVAIAMGAVLGFLLVASGVLYFLVRTLRDHYPPEDSEDPLRHGDRASSLEGSSDFQPGYQSDPVSIQYYRRYDDHLPHYCAASIPGGRLDPRDHKDPPDPRDPRDPTDPRDQDSDHTHHNTINTSLTAQERLRMLEFYCQDEHFADFVRQTQLFLGSRRSSTT
ncbi:unnamed protein product [Lota lota]